MQKGRPDARQQPYLMDEDFQDLLQQFHISDPIKDILNHLGYDCTLTFGLAFSSMQMLDQNIQRLLPPGEDDTTSPVCARLRALWSRCNSIHTSPPIPSAQTFPPTPIATPSPSTFNSSSNWHETLPPKLSSDDVTAMKQLFEKNYPGEVLDSHSTPSIRLWSLVHQQKVSKTIKYIPIQLRLSEHQYSAMIETRSSKPLRSEIQLLSQLCWDDTPEMDITSVRFSRDWFNRTSTVLRNAYVLCGLCHLQVFKAFDAKVAEHTFVQLDQELGLRHVVAQEFFSADKKIWAAISNLYSQGSWSFEECLHEMTVVRSDISSLLQPRPRIPKQLPPPRDPRGKGHKGKGGGKGKNGKGKTKSFTFDKKNQCTYGFNDNKKVTLCMKYNAGECKRGETVVLTSMPVQPVSKAEDHACSNTPRRTTGGPPDSNPTMIQCLTFNHLRLSTTSTHNSTFKILLQIQLHHLQFLLHLHSSLRQRTLHHLPPMLHLNNIRPIQKLLNLFIPNQYVCSLTFLPDTQLHSLVQPKL